MGRVPGDAEVEIDIPPAIETNDRMRVSGAGGYHVWRAVGIDNEFTLLGNTPDMYLDDCTVELDID